MSVVITSEDKAKYERDSEMEEKAHTWKTEIYKMIASLIINIFAITILAWGALYTSAELSLRFMSLLEIVVGAIFGVTATQVGKD
jgi:uncharacterized integral membrane protein